MSESQQNVRGFVLIAFVLLAALFGMIIMTFIFGNVSTGISTSFSSLGIRTVNNETGYLNSTTSYVVDSATARDFRAGMIVLNVFNESAGGLIGPGNYTVNPEGTVIANVNSDENYTGANYTYTYITKREAEQVAEDVNNNSLTAIRTYSTQANTQFTTAAIAITLAILIAVFLLFWKAFMGGTLGGGKNGRGGSGKASGMDV